MRVYLREENKTLGKENYLTVYRKKLNEIIIFFGFCVGTPIGITHIFCKDNHTYATPAVFTVRILLCFYNIASVDGFPIVFH